MMVISGGVFGFRWRIWHPQSATFTAPKLEVILIYYLAHHAGTEVYYMFERTGMVCQIIITAIMSFNKN